MGYRQIRSGKPADFCLKLIGVARVCGQHDQRLYEGARKLYSDQWRGCTDLPAERAY
jgi:hypothetical protein